MIDTKISWAHSTWNPWTGCNKISEECEGCYADEILTAAGRDFNILSPTQTGVDPYRIEAGAKKWNRNSICFVCSLSDFFHIQADIWRADAWRTIRQCPHLRFMLLTKRPKRIMECLPADWARGYPNVWLGTTCGVRASYKRVDILRSVPCTLRFLSVEPLLESVADLDLTGIGWVAVGGMSGPLHTTRKMDLRWAAEVHDLCKAQRIPFLFKQASNIHTERGINSLSLYLAERAGQVVNPETVPLIREYPKTELPLMPFTEHGKRFTMKECRAYQCST